jgi:hypothetical protein
VHQPFHCAAPSGNFSTSFVNWPCRNAAASSPVAAMSALWERSVKKVAVMPKILSRNDRVEVALRPSRAAAVFILASAAATLVVVLAVPLALTVRLGLVFLIGLMTLHAYRREASRTDRAIGTVSIDARGDIEVETRGSPLRGTVRAGCFVAPWLTVIRWRRQGQCFDATILVLPDMLPADGFRRLRVLLRWGSTSAAPRKRR